ncbi:hypothetical protein [Haloarcula brevis]|uniref:hypothetical protein n=1 Tax=Haloarcula brevis TaxID=3111453 RepID=UPI00300F3564
MRWLSTVAIAALFLTAGCNAFVGADTTERETLTPAPVPTATATAATAAPPGVTTDGLDNVALLSAAHRQRLNGTSYTLHERYAQYSTGRNDTSSVRRAETVTVESATRYRDELTRVSTDANGSFARYEQSTYADGTRWYERRDNGTVERQRGAVRFGRDKYAYRTAFYLNRYAVVGRSSTSVTTRNGTRVYRVRGSGGELPTTERLTAYRVELLVEPDGFVRRFSVRYRSEAHVVRYRFWYEHVGESAVTRPAWVNESTPAG